MVSQLVASVAEQAYDSLLLPPDIWYLTSSLQRDSLDALARDLHTGQTTAQSLIKFAEMTCEAWQEVLDLPLIDGVAVISALISSHRSLLRAMQYATRMAEVIVRKNAGEPDNRKYPRLIPPELADLTIANMDDITVDVMQRIFQVDPWLSYLQRIEAMRNRLVRTLQKHTLADLVDFKLAATPRSPIARVRPSRLARKSIRKAIGLYERLFDRSELRTFLRSPYGPALVVSGKRYDYHITMSSDTLLHYTTNLNAHLTPVSTHVFDKAGYELADVCVYFRDMPILDHLIAFKLNVSNEETEWDILRGMNVQTATRKFYNDPLADLKGLHDPLNAPRSLISNLAHYLGEPEPELALPRTSLAYQAFFQIGRFGSDYEAIMRRAYFSLRYMDEMDDAEATGGLIGQVRIAVITRVLEAVLAAARDGRL